MLYSIIVGYFDVLLKANSILIRVFRTPNRFSPSMFYLLLIDEGEPKLYKEATNSTDSSKWELGMKDEMQSL